MLVKGQNAQSQEAMMKLFPLQWLRTNINSAFELGKLLGVLSRKEQGALVELLGKQKIRQLTRDEYFDVVLAGVKNRDDVSQLLRAELNREGLAPLSSRRAAVLFRAEAGNKDQGRSPDMRTLNRIITGPEPSDAKGGAVEQSSQPLPHQPVPHSPRKKQ
jgi:hypothetical protein